MPLTILHELNSQLLFFVFTNFSDQNNWEIGNCFSMLPYACQIPEGINLSPIPIPLGKQQLTAVV